MTGERATRRLRTARCRVVRLVAVVVLLLGAGLGGALLLAGSRPLGGVGPGEVVGATASAGFRVGDSHVRQVRYADRAVFSYTFRVRNTGPVPLWLDGLAPGPSRATLLRPRDLEAGSARLGPYGETTMTVRILMTACERLSARAGSILATVRVNVRVLGVVPRTVDLQLPEQIRVGSAREASCPRATSTSRPPG